MYFNSKRLNLRMVWLMSGIQTFMIYMTIKALGYLELVWGD
jgi:hypothetical protein